MTRSPSSRSTPTELMMLDDELLQRVVSRSSPFCWKALGAVSSRFRSAVAALPPAPLLSLVDAGDQGTPIDCSVELLSGFNLTQTLARTQCHIQLAGTAPSMTFDLSCAGWCNSLAYRSSTSSEWIRLTNGSLRLSLGDYIALDFRQTEMTTFRFGCTRLLKPEMVVVDEPALYDLSDALLENVLSYCDLLSLSRLTLLSRRLHAATQTVFEDLWLEVPAAGGSRRAGAGHGVICGHVAADSGPGGTCTLRS